MLVANGCGKRSSATYPAHGCNIRTAWMVAEVLREHFFPPVRSRYARLDRYLRNGESPSRTLPLSDAQKASSARRQPGKYDQDLRWLLVRPQVEGRH